MKYDIIVIGGGHAGVEAANGAAKFGHKVLLITGNIDFIGEMPCNPAIGGVAKGNIVREIDALGGIMAKITDKAGIQFRMLNSSKGIAVWGPRAQTDRFLYRQLARECIESIPNVDILQDMVTEILTEGKVSTGIKTETGLAIEAKSVIVTTGTFLNGLAHIGENKVACGRRGELPSTGLSESIQKLGIQSGRLKTGTPARLDKDSIDYAQLEEQPGDENPTPFSFSTKTPLVNSAICWTLKTEIGTHDIIRDNLDKSPLYGLQSVEGVGPRYCPSIEDKVVRFGDRNGHTLFLEPEGLNRREMYLNGLSTSLPVDVQHDMIHSLPGFENAVILKPAYAIEYDYFEPTQLYNTLESRIIAGLYFAGQVNGTSGYEEAAGQGLVAGVNAALKLAGREPLIIGREQAYLGVLIDDLVTKGVDEPYRMFTSRAEYRILLRQDDADARLTPKAFELGLVGEERLSLLKRKLVQRDKLIEFCKTYSLKPSYINERLVELKTTALKQGLKLKEVVLRPQIRLVDLIDYIPALKLEVEKIEEDRRQEIVEAAEILIKYSGYIGREKLIADKLRRLENLDIEGRFDYDTVDSLSTEARQKLKKIQPTTIGQATRISGVNPADINILLILMGR